MNKNNVRVSPAFRKSKQQSSHPTPAATQLVPVLLRRGDRETFFYVPVCHVCRKPITDFEAANVAKNFDITPTESLGVVDGAEMLRLPGTAIAVHLDCDRDSWKPWVRATSVFSRDQRSPVEKAGWTAVGL